MLRCFCSLVLAALTLTAARADHGKLQPLSLKVQGVQRKALVHIPANAAHKPTPVVLVFHGHGGTMRGAAEDFDIHKHWPGAISVYLQGLPTATEDDPRGERTGWQKKLGMYGDRDVHFVENVLVHLSKQYQVDPRRIFATGFSNGASFVYVLWAVRGHNLTGVAPVAGVLPTVQLQPKACLHMVGEKDPRYKNHDQEIALLGKVNGCVPAGGPWHKESKLTNRLYPSPVGAPLVSVVHHGGHGVPDPAGYLIVRFFKELGGK